MPNLFLGLDCGGSTTRALIQDDQSSAIFRGQAGPANLSTTPNDQLQINLAKALEKAPQPNFACACFAGLATDDDRQRATEILKALCPNAKLRVERDYPAAFMASPDGTDVCVIAGTGSLICSKTASAQFVKSGGNGYVLGDDGSAFQYGRELLRHHLDLEKLDEIKQDLQQVFGTANGLEIISRVYKSPNVAQTLAKLAPAFARSAEKNELFATRFLGAESTVLASIVASHVFKFIPEKREITLSLAGGLWKISPIFEDALMNALHTSDSSHTYTANMLTRPPVEGAVILAKELI